jgi:hypothetical protein
LIDILRSYHITDGDAAFKEVMRDRIIKGPPFTNEERRLILKYCLDDVLLLEKLLEKLLPNIRHFGQALLRGEYVKLTAEIFHEGQPADPWSTGHLRQPKTRRTLRLRAVSDENLTHGLYDGTKLTQAQLREFLVRHKIKEKDWRKTEKAGKLGTAQRDWEALAKTQPEKFGGLPDAAKTVSQLREFQLIAGSDNRYRTPIWAFSTITGRMAPNGAAYPFATPSWTRPTLTPAPGTVLVYLDFASMEFGVAAAQSRCLRMLQDYAGEPYLILPILRGLAPRGATKQTHSKLRDDYKPLILAMQYGAGAGLVASRMNLRMSEGQGLVDLHHERYAGYWEWSDRRLQRAFDDGELVTSDGWRCEVSSRTSIFTARNWLVQAMAQSIFRYAALLMRQLGIKIIAVVHDAVLIEVAAHRVELDTARAVNCLERASRRFLHGLALRVDSKTICEGERFTDPRGAPVWDFVERTLHEIEEGKIDVETYVA